MADARTRDEESKDRLTEDGQAEEPLSPEDAAVAGGALRRVGHLLLPEPCRWDRDEGSDGPVGRERRPRRELGRQRERAHVGAPVLTRDAGEELDEDIRKKVGCIRLRASLGEAEPR